MLYLLTKQDYLNIDFLSEDELMSRCVNCFIKSDLTVKDLGYFIFKCLNEISFKCTVDYLLYYDFCSLDVDTNSFERYCKSTDKKYICIISSYDKEKIYYIVNK